MFHGKTFALICIAGLALGLLMPVQVEAASSGTVNMYRLYNPNSGEHFYTGDVDETVTLTKIGWRFEGIGWVAPKISSTPVYRLYNPNTGDHHYTTSSSERQTCIRFGWEDESIGWYSDDSQRIPLYREYNPNVETGTHNYTSNSGEHNYLVSLGWRDENIGWYGIGEGRSSAIPRRLGDLEPISQGDFIGVGTDIENMDCDYDGNIYDINTLICPKEVMMSSATSEREVSVEYFLNQKYNNISGTLYIPISSAVIYEQDRDADEYIQQSNLFEIYGDERLLYSDSSLTLSGRGVKQFSVGVSGVKVLRIKMTGLGWQKDENSWLRIRTATLCAGDVIIS